MVGFLPDNNMAEIPVYENGFEWETTDADRTLNTVIPDSPNQPYDIHRSSRTSSTAATSSRCSRCSPRTS
jgi:acetyl-CoA carboxylase carboxyltransferase component